MIKFCKRSSEFKLKKQHHHKRVVDFNQYGNCRETFLCPLETRKIPLQRDVAACSFLVHPRSPPGLYQVWTVANSSTFVSKYAADVVVHKAVSIAVVYKEVCIVMWTSVTKQTSVIFHPTVVLTFVCFGRISVVFVRAPITWGSHIHHPSSLHTSPSTSYATVAIFVLRKRPPIWNLLRIPK